MKKIEKIELSEYHVGKAIELLESIEGFDFGVLMERLRSAKNMLTAFTYMDDVAKELAFGKED